MLVFFYEGTSAVDKVFVPPGQTVSAAYYFGNVKRLIKSFLHV